MGEYSTNDHRDQVRSCLFILSTYPAQSLSVEVLCTSPRDTLREALCEALREALRKALRKALHETSKDSLAGPINFWCSTDIRTYNARIFYN